MLTESPLWTLLFLSCTAPGEHPCPDLVAVAIKGPGTDSGATSLPLPADPVSTESQAALL